MNFKLKKFKFYNKFFFSIKILYSNAILMNFDENILSRSMTKPIQHFDVIYLHELL